ncbi:hypothetical protein TWF730_000657 [Orbilia blumenaviensis]|uniref:Uncharacterized protein n=1 Tax=Orbilia blumenaviensis TaxID=1796055 RepID=A0AAV9VMB2_9PEZI
MSQGNYFLEHQFLLSKPFTGETVICTHRIPSFYTPQPPRVLVFPLMFDVPTATSGPFYHRVNLVYKYPYTPPGEAVVWTIRRPVDALDIPLIPPQDLPTALPAIPPPSLPPPNLLPPILPPSTSPPNFPIISPAVPSPFPQIFPTDTISRQCRLFPAPPVLPSAFPTVPELPIQIPSFTGQNNGPGQDWISGT